MDNNQPHRRRRPIHQEAERPPVRSEPPRPRPMPESAPPGQGRRTARRSQNKNRIAERRRRRRIAKLQAACRAVFVKAQALFAQLRRFLDKIPHDKKVDAMRAAAIIVLSCVSLYCFVSAIGIMDRTRRTKETNAELTALYEQGEQQEEAPEDWPEEAPGEAPEEAPPAEVTPLPESVVCAALPETDIPAETPVPTAAPAPRPEPKALPVVQSTQYQRLGGEPLERMKALHDRNKDLIGWISIKEVLDLPVVYRDNSYYLHRDFDKNKNDAGTLFLDAHHPFYEKTQNLLIHGHNMRDGTMFGRLAQYEESVDYLKNHAIIQFDSLWHTEYYGIFSVLHVPLDVSDEKFVAYYAHPNFSSDEAFNAYVRETQLKSIYAIPLDVRPSDALLTLSTCIGDDRLVIIARRLRKGETKQEIRQIIGQSVRQ